MSMERYKSKGQHITFGFIERFKSSLNKMRANKYMMMLGCGALSFEGGRLR